MRLPRAALLAGAGAVVYCGAVTWYLLTHGGAPTPDFLIPPLLLLAVLAGRGRAFLLDWTPFLLLLLAWESTRGIADRLGMPLQVRAPIEAERALFLGHIPTLLLQDWLYDHERGSRWFDWLGTIQHSLHFVLPVAFGFVFWLRDRALYWRYVLSVLLLFLLGFAGFVLFPQAPPWLAASLGEFQYTYRIGVGTILSLPVGDRVIGVYQHIRPNDVAAMPSLHAALPLLLSLILWRMNRPLAWCGIAYSAVLGFFLVYHGEHYVVDLIAGWALAGLVYWLVWATPRWVRRRLPATVGERRALALPVTAGATLLLVVGTAALLRPNAFGSEPAALLPEPAPETQAVEGQVLSGPCGVTQTFSGLADDLLAPVARTYAAYLMDPELGLCMALTEAQPLPPPNREEQRQIAAGGGTVQAPLAVSQAAGDTVIDMRVTASGPPSAQLAASGIPPGRYLLVVELASVRDVEAARAAATAIARAVLSTS